MSLFRSFLQAIRSWRRRPGAGGIKTSKRADVALERLDHRQLLSVNFTGIVTNDFPSSLSPGVVVLNANESAPDFDVVSRVDPTSPVYPYIGPFEGFSFNQVRVSYDPVDDTLSVGFNLPPNIFDPTVPSILTGDTDNNGNEGTVNPLVSAASGGTFKDFPNIGSGEFIGAFLDLTGDGNPDIIGGIPSDKQVPAAPGGKVFQVAEYINTISPFAGFGNVLPDNVGAFYLQNSPQHPNFEFKINQFRELYASLNGGAALGPSSTISIGWTGGVLEDDPELDETFVNLKPFTIRDATYPCPCTNPPILVNPHENFHINTAHPTDVKVAIFGSVNFDVSQIDPATVTLGGATAYAALPPRMINYDSHPDRVFLFNGSEIDAPPGITDVTVSGNLLNGTPFTATAQVFNRTLEYYTPQEQAAQAARQAVLGDKAFLTPIQRKLAHGNQVDLAIAQSDFTSLLARNLGSAGVKEGLKLRLPGDPTGTVVGSDTSTATPTDSTGTGNETETQVADNATTDPAATADNAAVPPVVRIRMNRKLANPVQVDSGTPRSVAIPTRNGQALQARKLRIDTSAARASLSR